MQDKKVNYGFVILGISLDTLEEANIDESKIIQITAGKGKIVIETVDIDDAEDIVCDSCCDECPVYATEGNNCPNRKYNYER